MANTISFMIPRILWAVAAVALLAFLIFESAVYGWTAGGVILVFAVMPDVALIGAFDPQHQGRLLPGRVAFYNALHRPWAPLALVVLGAVVPVPLLGGVDGGKLIAFAGLAWLLHIAADRVSGYGLRRSDGSIRPVGRSRTAAPCQA